TTTSIAATSAGATSAGGPPPAAAPAGGAGGGGAGGGRRGGGRGGVPPGGRDFGGRPLDGRDLGGRDRRRVAGRRRERGLRASFRRRELRGFQGWRCGLPCRWRCCSGRRRAFGRRHGFDLWPRQGRCQHGRR